MSWGSYPKIYALGHAALKELLFDEVTVEEKVDGSQFSFGIFGDELKCRSKGVEINVEAPEKMFSKAVATAQELSLQLKDGWTYRAEYLQKPKHNTLAYERVPEKNLIIFDVTTDIETYLPYEEKKAEAERIGLECIPLVYTGKIDSATQFKETLDTISILGKEKIEGVVIKNYNRFGPDKKVLLGKYVSEAFKERHVKDWKKANPNKKDFITDLALQYKTQARWRKAIEHLRDAGELEFSPRDIGKLIKEVPKDILSECEDEIKEQLFKWVWPQIHRQVVGGLPQFYKDYLVERQFEQEE